MRRCATFGSQDALSRQHTVDVIRLGEGAHHDDILAFCLCHSFSSIRIEIRLPNCCAGRRIHTADEESAALNCGLLSFIHKLRM